MFRNVIWCGLAASLLVGCLAPKGASVEEKRQYVRDMRNESRDRFEEAVPGLPARVGKAYGYAVFSNVAPKIFLVSPGHGYGIAVENATGAETFMRMASIGAGPGFGVVNQTTLFVFPTQESFDRFVEVGIEIGASGEVVATSGDLGGGLEAGAKATPSGVGGAGLGQMGEDDDGLGLGMGVEVYQLTKNGLAVQAAVRGTKYWQDPGLH